MKESHFPLDPVRQLTTQFCAVLYGISRKFVTVSDDMEMRRAVFVGVYFNLVPVNGVNPDSRFNDILLAVFFLNIVI